jgi:hypothetical protein
VLRFEGVRSSGCRIVDISSFAFPCIVMIRIMCGNGLGEADLLSCEAPSGGKGHEICSSFRVRGRPVPIKIYQDNR